MLSFIIILIILFVIYKIGVFNGKNKQLDELEKLLDKLIKKDKEIA